MAETRDTRPKKQIPSGVHQRKKNGKYVSDTMDKPPELDIS